MSDTDLQLLARYGRDRAEDAFAELVRRHVDLVHSAALRQVRAPQLAEEVAQSVFTDLSRNAHRFAPDTILTAWLYQVTRRTAIDIVRREARRQLREQIATEMNAMNAAAADWPHIEPLLDEAMSALDDSDRAAVLLRYFENKSLREVGQALGTSDDTAQKRVSRAVERLREFFAKRGVTVGSSGLAVFISANAIQAAPVGLAATISTAAALAGTTIATIATATATKAIAMTTLQKTLITATLVAAVGTGIYEARQAADLRTQVQMLHQQSAPFLEQMTELNRERNEATAKFAALRDNNERLNGNTAELLKLRGEVARLRNDSQALAQLKAAGAATEGNALDSAARSWLTRVDQLKQGLKQMPDKEIPEVRLLGEKEWLEAVKRFDQLGSESEMRKALSSLRELGKQQFAELVRKALRGYAEANEGRLPAEISQLKPYFSPALDDAVLQRYQIAQTGKLNDALPKEPLVIETAAPVDDQHDTNIKIRMSGTSVTTIPGNDGILRDALQAFSAANNGREPNDPAQLLPFARTPEQQALIQRLIQTQGRR